jgi:hypothetical protein
MASNTTNNQQSGSWMFPFKLDENQNCLARTYTIEDAVMSAIRAFLVTRPGSRVGNNIGSFVSGLLFTLIPTSALPAFATELRNELTQQFDGVEFLNVTLSLSVTQPVVCLVITITFSIASEDDISELIVELPSVFDSNQYSQFQQSL